MPIVRALLPSDTLKSVVPRLVYAHLQDRASGISSKDGVEGSSKRGSKETPRDRLEIKVEY